MFSQLGLVSKVVECTVSLLVECLRRAGPDSPYAVEEEQGASALVITHLGHLAQPSIVAQNLL